MVKDGFPELQENYSNNIEYRFSKSLSDRLFQFPKIEQQRGSGEDKVTDFLIVSCCMYVSQTFLDR